MNKKKEQLNVILAPLYNRILVKRYQRVSTIIVPDNARDGSLKLSEGEIIAVGKGADPVLKVGMKVGWGKHTGAEMIRGTERYVIMNDEDIFGELIGGYTNV